MTRNWQSIKMGHVVTSVSGDLCDFTQRRNGTERERQHYRARRGAS